MDKDRIKGKAKDIAGRVQRQAGEWTGDEKSQARGAAKQVEGKLQNVDHVIHVLAHNVKPLADPLSVGSSSHDFH